MESDDIWKAEFGMVMKSKGVRSLRNMLDNFESGYDGSTTSKMISNHS
jgi:hypothetical protein